MRTFFKNVHFTTCTFCECTFHKRTFLLNNSLTGRTGDMKYYTYAQETKGNLFDDSV